MRASEFINKTIPFADGELVVSKHFINDRSDGTERNIPIENVFRVLHKLETRRGSELVKMPFVSFVVRTNDLSVGMSKQKDKFGQTAYVVTTAHPTLKAPEDEDVFYLEEEVLDEMPLPSDWDPQQMRQGATSFKSRLAYALERAKKLGTGSSRVATVIEYQGRNTVLKIAKNQKGLAQNSVEADILSDGYASQLGILIPIIDYDEQNREPSWIHTEMATKASEKQLCELMKCPSLQILINYAWSISGKKKYMGLPEVFLNGARNRGMSDDDIETYTEYANTLADLATSFDVELGDFTRKANWGIYQGKPVIVDVGFNSNVLNQYYR